MLGSTFRATVLNIRFDVMEEEGKDAFPWAHIHYVGEVSVQENFAGALVAKMPLVRDNNNELAKKIHKTIAEHFPCEMDISFTMAIKAGVTVVTCTGLTPVLK
jgi:hypothetical protein